MCRSIYGPQLSPQGLCGPFADWLELPIWPTASDLAPDCWVRFSTIQHWSCSHLSSSTESSSLEHACGNGNVQHWTSHTMMMIMMMMKCAVLTTNYCNCSVRPVSLKRHVIWHHPIDRPTSLWANCLLYQYRPTQFSWLQFSHKTSIMELVRFAFSYSLNKYFLQFPASVKRHFLPRLEYLEFRKVRFNKVPHSSHTFPQT